MLCFLLPQYNNKLAVIKVLVFKYPPTTTMGSWRQLPAEIRRMIYEFVEKNHNYKTEPLARAGYASVCREWQCFFEPLNFQRLVVDQDGLNNFDKFTKGLRQGFVKHVWLRVRLDEYDCSACSVPEADLDVDGKF